MDFTEKFFGYFLDEEGQYNAYSDNLRNGSFEDWRHFLWIIATPIIGVVIYRYFRRHKDQARITIVCMAAVLLFLRLTFQILKVTYGDEEPFARVIPFHQCAVMGFILPLVVFFNIKPLKMPVYTISFMGAIATIAFGEYFTSAFMPFYSLEGIISHTLLLLIPLIDIASGEFSFDIKKSWSVFVGMLILLGWASLANEVFFKEYEPNYMYLQKSGFPSDFGGSYYFLLYVIIFFFVYAAIFVPPLLYKKRQAAHEQKQKDSLSVLLGNKSQSELS